MTAVSAGTSDVIGAAPEAQPEVAAKPNRKRIVVAGIVGTVALAGSLFYVSRRGLESTDDAQIDADVVALAPRTAGLVVRVHVTDNQPVKAGDVLVELDDAPAKARLAQAEASLNAAIAGAEAADAEARIAGTNARANKNVASASLLAASAGAGASRDQIAEADARVASAEALLAQATTERDRTAKLVAAGALGPAVLDAARASFDTANAQVAQARANRAALKGAASQAASRVQEASAKAEQTQEVDVFITQAEARAKAAHAQVEQLRAARDLAALDLSYTKVTAPHDGLVSKKVVAVGQLVAAGTPIAQLVPGEKVWVTANFKETQIAKMHAGQPVTVQVDALPGQTLRGEVESFAGATGSRFALLPPDNASGNFTKVVQRVPVRIRIVDAPAGRLVPGMNAALTVDTRP